MSHSSMRVVRASIRLFFIIVCSIAFFLSGFAIRNRRKVLFGAWLGKKCADNPKYLLLYLSKQELNLDIVWIGENEVKSKIPSSVGVRFVTKGSIAACWEMLTAGACFVSHGMIDLGRLNLMRGACRVYLGHGLAIKNMGSKQKKSNFRVLETLRRLHMQTRRCDYYIASSNAHREKLLIETAICNAATEKIINCGQPRIDFLCEKSHSGQAELCKDHFLKAYELSSSMRVITYLPTFRDSRKSSFSFTSLDDEQRTQLNGILADLDAIIVEKCHFSEVWKPNEKQNLPSQVYSITNANDVDTQELLLVTDLLITDYSGCYIDFLALKRPIIHFAYDRKYYENEDRGLYFNLDEIAGGPIVQSFEMLCCMIEKGLQKATSHRDYQERARKKLIEYEQGSACRQIVDTVFKRTHSQTAWRSFT